MLCISSWLSCVFVVALSVFVVMFCFFVVVCVFMVDFLLLFGLYD